MTTARTTATASPEAATVGQCPTVAEGSGDPKVAEVLQIILDSADPAAAGQQVLDMLQARRDLTALLDRHGIALREVDPGTTPIESIHAALVEGANGETPVLFAPHGQDPAERLRFARRICDYKDWLNGNGAPVRSCEYTFPSGRACVADHAVTTVVHQAPAEMRSIPDGSSANGKPSAIEVVARIVAWDEVPGQAPIVEGVLDLGAEVIEIKTQAEARAARDIFLNLANDLETIGAHLGAEEGKPLQRQGQTGPFWTQQEVATLVSNAITTYLTQNRHTPVIGLDWNAVDIIEGAEDGLTTATQAALVLDRCADPDYIPGADLSVEHDAILSRVERDLGRLSGIYQRHETRDGGDYAARVAALLALVQQRIEANATEAQQEIKAVWRETAGESAPAAAGVTDG